MKLVYDIGNDLLRRNSQYKGELLCDNLFCSSKNPFVAGIEAAFLLLYFDFVQGQSFHQPQYRRLIPASEQLIKILGSGLAVLDPCILGVFCLLCNSANAVFFVCYIVACLVHTTPPKQKKCSNTTGLTLVDCYTLCNNYNKSGKNFQRVISHKKCFPLSWLINSYFGDNIVSIKRMRINLLIFHIDIKGNAFLNWLKTNIIMIFIHITTERKPIIFFSILNESYV